MRRICLICSFLLISLAALADGRDERNLITAAKAFDQALVQKDSIALKKILSPEIRYGHSNGWIETKAEVIADLYNGKLSYKSISWIGAGPLIRIDGNTGLVSGEVAVEVSMNGNPLSLKLSVLQVWLYKKGNWVLIGRQSGKVG